MHFTPHLATLQCPQDGHLSLLLDLLELLPFLEAALI
jgi:hypothetical protein